jgi:glutathione S-transferase
MAPHIVLQESGLKYETEPVNLREHKTKSGADFYKVNPKGSVPTLQLDNGEILTEGAVIMQYIADQKPEKNLVPKFGTLERYRCQEWLNYLASELHKTFSPLFRDTTPAEYKEITKQNLGKKFDYLSEKLKGHDFLMGKQFTVADAYLFTLLGWTKGLKMDLSKWPVLMGYCERVQNRAAVQAVQKAEADT